MATSSIDIPQFVNFASTEYAKTHGERVAGGEWFLDKSSDGMPGWLPGAVFAGDLEQLPELPPAVPLLGAVVLLSLLLWAVLK